MKSRHRIIFTAALTLVPVMAISAAESNRSVQVPGVYSDLYYNDQSGDLGGMEVFIVVGPGERPGEPGYFAFVQFWEGGPNHPVAVRANVDGAKVSFVIPPPSTLAGECEGTITKTGIDGECMFRNGYDRPFSLKRKKSYWELHSF